MESLTKEKMLLALKALDEILSQPIKLIVGGGGAMILAHHFRLGTSDVDGIAVGIDSAEFDVYVKKVAKKLSLPGDWLNPYYSTFTHVLPEDYGSRLLLVCEFSKLKVFALGKEDLLIMKCFAGRQKDIPHAKALIKQGANLKLVEGQLSFLKERRVPGTDKAMGFLDDILDQV